MKDPGPSLDGRLRSDWIEPGDATPPPGLLDAVHRSARATPQEPRPRFPGGARIGPAAAVVVALAVTAAAVLVLLGDGSRERVAATPTPAAGSPPVTAHPSAPAASTSPSPPPLVPGTVAEATAPFSIVEGFPVLVGQRLLVVDGPLDHDGVRSYLLQHWGDLEHGIRPDSDFGWLPADEARTSLRPVTVACPGDRPSLRDVAALQLFERPLCFGDRPLTFATVTVTDYAMGARTSHRWISDDRQPGFFTGLPVYFEDTGLDTPDGAWVAVTGHFDDPSAADCGGAAEVAWCRERFVVTAVERVDPPATVLRVEWRKTTSPPIGGRSGHAAVWTGREMLVWGGYESTERVTVFDGFLPRYGAAYDPSANSWRQMATAPIAGREQPLAAWTGREMIVWGGLVGEVGSSDGAAYDPVDDRWTKLPEAPLARADAVGGWIDGRFLVVTPDGAAAYDPVASRWEQLEAAPVRPGWRVAAIAAGRLVVIAFGDGATGEAEGAVFDPSAGTWTRVEVPLVPLDAGAGLVGAGDLALVPAVGKALDPAIGAWRDVAPCRGAENGPAWTGRYVLGVSQAFDTLTGRCLDLPPSPPRAKPFDDSSGREFPVAVWTGTEYVTWSGGNGGDIVWVPDDGAVFRPAERLDP